MEWIVYILECGDGSLYTGCTNNIEKRIVTHNMGKGGKYTRSHLPVVLVYKEKAESKSQALKREWEIKKMSRKDKLKLIDFYVLEINNK